MNHLALMGVVKGVGDRYQQAHNLGGRRDFSHVSRRTQIVGERCTLHVIHNNVGFASALSYAEILYRYDIGMAQRCEDFCFAIETLREIGASLCITRDDFNRNVATLLRVKCLPDLTNSTRS